MNKIGDELHAERAALEDKILELIWDFSNKTGLAVSDIHVQVQNAAIYGKPYEALYGKLEIEIKV
jgi:hypothetical protein